MKKSLALRMAVIFMLLAITTTTFANDMKDYRNDTDHYSISIPGDFNYQDVSKLNSSALENISFLALDMLTGKSIFIEKIPEIFYFPSANHLINNNIIFWNDALKNEYIGYGFKADYSFKESGTMTIHNQNFNWEKYEDSKQETIVYMTFYNNMPYKIYYVYPNNNGVVPDYVMDSINSLKFDDVKPNWSWIYSNNTINLYMDRSNITDRVDPAKNTKYKVVIYKMMLSNSSTKTSVGIKKINNEIYYRIFSSALLDSDENVQYWHCFADKDWVKIDRNSNSPIDIFISKIADLLFEKTE